MKKFQSTLLLLTWLLGACSTRGPAAETESTKAPANATVSSAVEMPVETGTAVPGREAVLSDIENQVSVRESEYAESISAVQGMTVFEGGSIETGDNSRVRVDLLPDGTIIRVGPNSSFSIPKLAEENGEPTTTIQLIFGKVFILLNGGSLDVETPSGVASVRGSLLSVEYDPQTKRVNAACLEGHCGIKNEDGEEVEIPEGQESFIEDGELPIVPFLMDQDEVQAWLDENPDLDLFLPELPNPEDFPDLPPDFDGNYEDLPPELLPDGDGLLDGDSPLDGDGPLDGDPPDPGG